MPLQLPEGSIFWAMCLNCMFQMDSLVLLLHKYLFSQLKENAKLDAKWEWNGCSPEPADSLGGFSELEAVGGTSDVADIEFKLCLSSLCWSDRFLIKVEEFVSICRAVKYVALVLLVSTSWILYCHHNALKKPFPKLPESCDWRISYIHAKIFLVYGSHHLHILCQVSRAKLFAWAAQMPE